MLDLLWWAGLAWFAFWTALPLALSFLLGPALGLLAWPLLAPWTALLGIGLVHRLLPESKPGSFRLFADPGAIRWALKGWAPSLYLTVFQPLFFMSPGFQRLALRAFQARLGPGSLVTSRTVVREPHRITIGCGTLVGEYAHLIGSYQPRPGLLLVADIVIGDRVLVGAYGQIGPGARIGSGTILEHEVRVGAFATIGPDCRIGAGTAIYNSVRIGPGARIGKRCLIAKNVVIPPGARIPDGTVLPNDSAREAAA
jgi:UDP-3-O-[3-hydroxymyristoyl] glucosamine N-acyltransferase